jgi:hypothetical protein
MNGMQKFEYRIAVKARDARYRQDGEGRNKREVKQCTFLRQIRQPWRNHRTRRELEVMMISSLNKPQPRLVPAPLP